MLYGYRTRVKGLGGLLGGGSGGAGKGGGEKLGTAGSCGFFLAVPDGFGSDAFGDDAFGSDPKDSPADAVAGVSDASAAVELLLPYRSQQVSKKVPN